MAVDSLTLESKLILMKILSCVSQKAKLIAKLRGQLGQAYFKPRSTLFILTTSSSIFQMQMILMRLSLHHRSRMAR